MDNIVSEVCLGGLEGGASRQGAGLGKVPVGACFARCQGQLSLLSDRLLAAARADPSLGRALPKAHTRRMHPHMDLLKAGECAGMHACMRTHLQRRGGCALHGRRRLLCGLVAARGRARGAQPRPVHLHRPHLGGAVHYGDLQGQEQGAC